MSDNSEKNQRLPSNDGQTKTSNEESGDGSSSANYRVNSKSSVRPRVYKSRHSGIGAVCSSGSGLSSSSTENVTNLNQRLPSNDGQTKTSNEESGEAFQQMQNRKLTPRNAKMTNSFSVRDVLAEKRRKTTGTLLEQSTSQATDSYEPCIQEGQNSEMSDNSEKNQRLSSNDGQTKTSNEESGEAFQQMQNMKLTPRNAKMTNSFSVRDLLAEKRRKTTGTLLEQSTSQATDSYEPCIQEDGSSSANYRVNSKSSVRPRVYKSRHSEIGAVRSSGSGLSSSSTENVTNLKGIKHYEELTTQEIPKTIHQTCPREEIKDKCAFGVNRMQSTLCTFDSNESDTDQSPETEIQEDYSHKIREQSSDQHESEADFECHQNPGQFNDTCVSDSESQPAETVILDNEKQTDIEQTIDQGQYEDDSSEKLLIKFLKMQENTLLDDLLLDLNQNNKWDVNDETNYVGQVVDDEDAADPIIEEVNEKDPVSPGHWLSLQTSVLLIWMYAITHSITSSQLSDLITLINLHLVIAHPVFSSLYRFKNFFANTKLPSESLKHYYCCHCTASVSVNTEVCPNNLCRKPLDRSKLNYFLELNVQSQLKNMFSRKDFLDGLKHRFNRFKKKKENIEDVYDSENYKALFYNNGPLSDENNLSFIFNTDGVPIFKSSKTSVWPIFLMINELPYKMRKCREFMLLAGLWCGPTKPAMNLFLSPLQKSLTELERGITVCKNGEEVITRAFLFGISCDLPARSAVLNMNNHNGECSCIKCNQKGENYRTQKGGNIRTFPYIIDNPGGPARDHDTIIQHAFSASESTSSHINGIKGPSVVMFCPEFDVVKGTAIDYMHLVCLGIVRLLLNLWFNVSNSLKHFSMYQYVNVVDSRLTNFKPPHYITRQPRSISEHLKFWKAAELRAWLFYYSIPCISDLLHPTYLYHYCAFVEAIYLLCQSSISEHDLEKSQKLLQYFVLMMPSLYDQRYVTLNAHSLLHLPQTVKDLSPLWSNSCFSFEGANGELLKMFHGTQHIDLQIVNAVHVFQLLPSIADTIPFENTPALKFVKSLQKEDQQQDNVDQFSFCGKGYEKHLSQACKQLLGSFLNGNISILKFYSRAYVRKVMFHSKDYIRISKRNSYSVKFINNGSLNYGFILWFAEHIPDGYEEGRQKFACVEKLIMKDGFSKMFDTNVDGTLPDKQTIDNFMDIKLPNMVQLVPEGVQCFIPLENILELCICLETDKSITFCEEPNYHEKNL